VETPEKRRPWPEILDCLLSSAEHAAVADVSQVLAALSLDPYCFICHYYSNKHTESTSLKRPSARAEAIRHG
jgi:hypothetical protein